ncbi:hypothetical protein M2139_000528 [Enterococcus sp. PF1-24]|uniref:cell division protein FtsK n=1 Tax=unclassified Enterococcus TaxID=2608891 RepID=UPI002475AC9D|nr:MULTISPECIES: cell division protein FtsK [unclassified Enterococcus]MDH6363691.1 hypothetical protein [Enterococcus sp. PFB1-1]MDH6400647.1 hypothetical protein [Enterococcus sp. PF1-24]
MKKFFVYRGIRIRKLHNHIYGIYQFGMMIPFFVACVIYSYKILYPYLQSFDTNEWFPAVVKCLPILVCLMGGYLIVFLTTRTSYVRNGFFNRVRERQALANMIEDNRFYKVKKVKKTSNKKTTVSEKKIYPRIYYRNSKNFVSIFLPMDGSRHQDKFMKMGNFFEYMFLADNMGVLNHKGFVEYRLLSNVEGSRIDVTEMKATGEKVLLMRNVYWYFNDQPHLLIGGGTGGGKTYTMMSLMLALLPVAEIEICDPKNSDLMALNTLTVFEGKVFTGKAILGCLRRATDDMIKRYKYMKDSPKFKMGRNYSYYGLPPKFIVIDEWASFMTEIESMEDGYKLVREANAYLTQLILKARQAGIFIILAMQRPDGTYIPTALRDNFMFRMSVGILSSTGLEMIFGDVNKNKNFKAKKIKGHGYIAEGGNLAQEFFSPFVPEGFNFYQEFSKFKSQVSFNLDDMNLTVSEKQELLKEMEKEPVI